MSDREFRDLLRSARLRAAFSQRELAQRAGISERAVSDLERGLKKRPHPYTLRALAEALALDGEAFVAKADIDERTVQKKSLMPDGQHKTMSPAEFADLIAYLRSL